MIPMIRLMDTSRESLDLGVLVDWCVNLMPAPPHPFVGYLTHLDGDFVHFDCLGEIAHDSAYTRELKKLYRAELRRAYIHANTATTTSSSFACRIGELCLIDCTPSTTTRRHQQQQQQQGVMKCDSLMALNDTAVGALDNETSLNETSLDQTGKGADLCRGVIIDITLDKCVLLNLDDGKKLTVNKWRLHECPALLARLPFMLVRAKLVHDVDEATRKQLNQSRFYGEPISLTVLGDSQLDPASTTTTTRNGVSAAKTLLMSQHERKLYKLVQMSWRQQVTIVVDGSGEGAEVGAGAGNVAASATTTTITVKTPSSPTPLYYKLSYVKSLNHFYIHTSESMKRLKEMEDEMRVEYENGRAVRGKSTNGGVVSSSSSSSVEKGRVYGYYLDAEDKFYRVRLLQMDSGEAFFLDYGFMRNIQMANLFEVLPRPQIFCV